MREQPQLALMRKLQVENHLPFDILPMQGDYSIHQRVLNRILTGPGCLTSRRRYPPTRQAHGGPAGQLPSIYAESVAGQPYPPSARIPKFRLLGDRATPYAQAEHRGQ